MTEDLLKTPLYNSHIKHGGKVVPFAGWALPVQFSGLIEEHKAVREKCGIFDVSHMGEIVVVGADAKNALQQLLCNDLSKLTDGKGQYSAILNEKGGVVDDIIAYKRSDAEYFLCVNASNADKDYEWLKNKVAELKLKDCRVINVSASFGQIAVQGPDSPKIVSEVLKNDSLKDLEYFTFTDIDFIPEGSKEAVSLIVARTGYTGETGYEIFVPTESTEMLWELFTEYTFEGHKGVTLCGLGARDTLRLEVCYPLHGHELGEDVSALESKLAWIIKFDKGDFIGRDALLKEKESGSKRQIAGLFVEDAGIIRHGDKVYSKETNTDDSWSEIGHVTSGTKTPTVNKALGIALLDIKHTALNSEVYVDVRGRKLKCKVVKMPFWNASTK